MSDVLIIVGSPRRRGNTATMAEELVTLLGRGQILHLSDLELGPCIDCRGCKTGPQECVVIDGMSTIDAALRTADTVVIGTPIYWYGPTAQTKLMLDRLRPYFGNQQLAGKALAGLLPAGSGPGDCDLTTEMLRRMAEALGMSFLGTVAATAFDAGDVRADSSALAELSLLAERIVT